MTTNRKENRRARPTPSPRLADHLPVRHRPTELIDPDEVGSRAAVERAARAYYGACRRLARLLNGS
ncbi:hypothetical protein DL240_10635 [Lujinxingia litoralis]|uniref:Uncharacterized protein n=1 Tax=Lujinxingia litoralis TaxID=2211119 RepID=A0A328C7B9_9DELT|nr:hypothetical protein [Lujinxingia litoralis]RAL22300.1 hypothetical protein DL240_10635 [Lujinxingia litoralis]